MAKICILLPCHWGAAPGGAEFQSHLLAEYLSNHHGHSVTFLASRTPEQTDTYRYLVRRIDGPTLPGGLRWGRAPDTWALLRALQQINPDVIVQMVASAYTGVAAWYAQQHHRLLYWYVASDMDVAPSPNVGIVGPAAWVDRAMFRYGLKHATYIVVQTESQARALKENFNRNADLVIPNFLPPIEVTPRRKSVFTVSWIANIKGLKRPELFIELARSFRHHEGIVFRMAGRPGRPQLARLVDEATAELPHFSYLGELSLDGVETELEQADVLVNTSDYEGFPNTFIQAWLHSVPVLSLNVDPDGVMGRYQIGIKAGSLAKLKECILELMASRDQLQSMGTRARRYALENHSLDNAGRLLSHLENAIRVEPG